jgi:hypothetical protein
MGCLRRIGSARTFIEPHMDHGSLDGGVSSVVVEVWKEFMEEVTSACEIFGTRSDKK